MVDCPKCGEPMTRGKRGKYFCESQKCPVIFVRRPASPSRMKLASASSIAPSESISTSSIPAASAQ